MQTDRRLFILSAAAAASLYSGPLLLFTTGEAKFMEALVDQIIPADDAPGAAQAGVVFYIDKQLSGPLQRFAPAYQRSIPLFQSACLEKTGKDFLALPFAGRTAFLQFIEGRANPALASFFSMVTDHAMQGFYGSPAHGGNLDSASWKMLDIEDVMEGHRH